jgi:multiple sugar transport system substrate-binding protein
MMKRWLVLLSGLTLVAAACGGGTGATGTPGGTVNPTGTAAASGTPAGSPTASPAASGVTGDLKMGGWSAAGSTEEDILNGVLQKFEDSHPGITVTFESLAESYDSLMLNKLGTDNAPDVAYVNQPVAQDWIAQGVLAAFEDLPSAAGNDTSHFYPGFLAPFQRDGKTYGYPKDSSVLGMQTNDAMLTAASVTAVPTTTDELVAAATAIKNANIPDLANGAPMCFSNEWQRAGAFVFAYGGSMVTDDMTASAIDSPESKTALDWYLKQIHDGLAMTPTDLGVDWCGAALSQKLVAIAFEGNWVGPAMKNDAPDVAYTVSAIPKATEQATLSFTAGYAIAQRSQQKEAAWVLLQWLTSKEGMQEWVNGGLVLPARDDLTVSDAQLAKYAPFGAFAHQGEGYMPQWSVVSDAFKSSLLSAAQSATGTSDTVITATKAALDQVLSGAPPSASPSSSP